MLHANYDPNDTGRVVELEVGEPSVFIQLPEAALGQVLSRLPMRRGVEA